MRKLGVLAVVIAVGAAAAWYFYFRYPGQAGELILYGNVDIHQAQLAFRNGGRIAEMLVNEGDKVEKGQALARLDTDLLEQGVRQAQSELDAQQANLERMEKGYRAQEIAQARENVASAKAVAQNATQNLERVRRLARSNAVSQKELDNAVAQNQEGQAAVRSAEEQLQMLLSGYRTEEVVAQRAQVANAMARLETARIQLADAMLCAPEAGVILTRAREPGAVVGAGQTVYTLTLTDPVWLRAYVDEPYLGLIKPGMAVNVEVDAAPGKKFPGVVGFIATTAEFTPKTVETMEVRTSLVYRLRIIAEDPENVMRQGMPVTILTNVTK